METDSPVPLTVRAQLTEGERQAALQLARRNASLLLGPARWMPAAIIVATLLLLFLSQSLPPHWRHLFTGWTWLFAFLAAYALAVGIAVRLQRRLATQLPSQLEVTAGSDHLILRTEHAAMRWPWSAVTGCESFGDMLAISVRGLLTISVPLRSFESAEAIQRFTDHVRSHLNAPGTAVLPPQLPGPLIPVRARSVTNFLRHFAYNLYAGVLLLLLHREASERLRVSIAQFALLVILDATSTVALAWLESGGRGYFNWYGLPNSLFFIITILAAASVAGWLAGRPERVLSLAVAIAALGLPASLLLQVAYLVVDPSIATWLWWGFISWTAVASAVAALRILEAPVLRSVYVAPAVMVALTVPLFFLNYADALWIPYNDRHAEAADYRAQYERVGSEAVLYAQPRLLDEALRAVAPGQPGVVELFYVGFAGSGYQDVFLNEVKGAERVLKERFALGSHSVILANSIHTPEERPFATVTALRRTLEAVAGKMNLDEDILFLFLTAHGSAKHELDVQMFPYRFKPLSATQLREMLDAAGIKNRVIVVSACYAGGFIQPNQGSDALIITAAHAEKKSFGCRDGAQWTYFGQAFFNEALAHAGSFEEGFGKASQSIRMREHAEKLDASEPQIFVGDSIRAPLEALYERRRRPPQ